MSSPSCDLEKTITASPIDIINGPFIMARLSTHAEIPPTAVATFRDPTELTVVVPLDFDNDMENVLATEGPFTLLRVRVSVPFLVEGFLAAIAGALAEVHINVLIWSTFSYDYAFVRSGELQQAIAALKKRGFPEGTHE